MWKLPDGKFIKNPVFGKTFRIGDVNHNESCLLYWSDDDLIQAGIYKVKEVGYDSRKFNCKGYTEEAIGQTIIRRPILQDNPTYLENHRTAKMTGLNIEVNRYICAHYDLGTQSSFQAIYSSSDDPAVRVRLERVYAWVKAVLAYYYSVKDAILAAPDLDALDAITWDYTQFDATDPEVFLQSFVGGS